MTSNRKNQGREWEYTRGLIGKRRGIRVESDSPPGSGNVARVLDYSIKP